MPFQHKLPHDDMFTSGAHALVCPVNLVGVLGAGLAAEFKRRWPDAAEDYVDACLDQPKRVPQDLKLTAGEVLSLRPEGENTPLIIFAPTKRHWRDRSDPALVVATIAALGTEVLLLHTHHVISSVAVPALGCGLGGLGWSEVAVWLQRGLSTAASAGLNVYLYPPHPHERRK